jgi:hypothetical protein
MLDVYKPVGCSLQQGAQTAFALQERTLAQVFADSRRARLAP